MCNLCARNFPTSRGRYSHNLTSDTNSIFTQTHIRTIHFDMLSASIAAFRSCLDTHRASDTEARVRVHPYIANVFLNRRTGDSYNQMNLFLPRLAILLYQTGFPGLTLYTLRSGMLHFFSSNHPPKPRLSDLTRHLFFQLQMHPKPL